ncbi:UNVERIFIED_CONTAM: hypothetical protein KB574_00015 [Streptococcus canis]
MFSVTSKQGFEQTFPSRDDLFLFLDTENAKLRQLGEKGFFTLQQLNGSGEVVDLSNLRLPYSETLDKLLKDFGKVKESKLQAVIQKESKPLKEDKPQEKDQEIPTIPISAPQPPAKKSPKALLAFGLLQVALLGGLAGFSWVTNQATQKELADTKATIHKLQTELEKTHSADVFVRYFLPHYYSGEQSSLTDYLSKGQKIAVQSGQVLSVILEKTELKGQTLSLTYVLLLKTEVGQENIRLTVPVKQKAKAKYGYEIAGELIKESFPK